MMGILILQTASDLVEMRVEERDGGLGVQQSIQKVSPD
jgi:hypothetical protein